MQIWCKALTCWQQRFPPTSCRLSRDKGFVVGLKLSETSGSMFPTPASKLHILTEDTGQHPKRMSTRIIWFAVSFCGFLFTCQRLFNCYRARTNTRTQLLFYTNWENKCSRSRCSASKTNNGAQIFITWHGGSVRQLFLALCFYTTKHRLEYLSPSEVWVREKKKHNESSRDERWMWSDQPRREKKKNFCLTYGNELFKCFYHLGFLFTLIAAKRPCRENNARMQI